MRQTGWRQINVGDERLQDLPGERPLHGDDRPLLGRGGQPHLEFRPFRLPVILHHREHTCRAAGRRRHVKTIGGGARDDAVVVDETVVAQQDPVTRAADREVGPVVDVEPVQEFGCIGTDDRDFSERGCIEYSAGRANRAAFARDRGMHVLTGLRKIPRPFPQADILEHRATRLRPLMHRCRAHRIEEVAARHAGETSERHGRIRHAKRGVANFGNRFPETTGDDAERIEVGSLALVGRHPDRRVALEMLDGAKALAGGERQVIRGDVILEVDESF